MKSQKKYCLNVSSYKYKRECMKLFSTTLKAFNTCNSNENIESENLCPGGKHCKNYGLILNLEQKIKSLNDTVNQLTKINEYSENNHNKNITPTKNIEPKRHDSFNEFCNSFRNSVKKKRFSEKNRNLTGSISLQTQVSEPYRIKPYNSFNGEAKIPFKKMSNKKHINLDISNFKNYKNRFHNNVEKNDINEEFFINKKENSDIEKNKEENNIDININKKEEDNNKFQKLYTSISSVYTNEEAEKILSNNNSPQKEKNNKEKNIKKEINNENKSEQVLPIINIKENNKEKNKLNNNTEEMKTNINNINLPEVRKVKTYKLIIPMKQNKNKRYDFELFDNKIKLKEDNKLYFRKYKGKMKNLFNSSHNKFLSSSFGHRNYTEGSNNFLSIDNKNSKTLSNQDRYNKIKLNLFTNFKPLSLTQKPFKVKTNINQKDFFINDNKRKKLKYNDFNINDYNNLSNSFELNNFIKELEIKKEGSDKNKTFNEIYNLLSSQRTEIIDKINSLTSEKLDKYLTFVKNSLKCLEESIDIIYKIKLFYNLKNKNNNNNKGNANQNNFLINEDFFNYKKELMNLLSCENINIYIYDPISDYLISKGEKDEIKYRKDKDLIGLSFTSGKKIRYEADNSASLPLLPMISNNNSNQINNLLIYPLKDKNDYINGVLEAINKIQDKENNSYNNKYFKEKSSFNKKDEIILSLISKDLGNFCKYYNEIKYNITYISYYHALLKFFQNLFMQNVQKENNIFNMINEVIGLTRNIFNMNDIKFLICINNKDKEYFYDIQKNKNIPFEGLIYKTYIEKKINYASKPLINKYYSNKADLIVNILNINKNEELITIPILDFKNIDNVLMIIQIKTSKKLGNIYNNNLNNNDKLSDENYFIIENISKILEKYLYDNSELIQAYK